MRAWSGGRRRPPKAGWHEGEAEEEEGKTWDGEAADLELGGVVNEGACLRLGVFLGDAQLVALVSCLTQLQLDREFVVLYARNGTAHATQVPDYHRCLRGLALQRSLTVSFLMSA